MIQLLKVEVDIPSLVVTASLCCGRGAPGPVRFVLVRLGSARFTGVSPQAKKKIEPKKNRAKKEGTSQSSESTLLSITVSKMNTINAMKNPMSSNDHPLEVACVLGSFGQVIEEIWGGATIPTLIALCEESR